MDLRRLLLLTYHFPPSAASGSFRLLGFARHLPKFGWTSVVVAPPQMPWEPLDPELAKQLPPEVILESVPYPQGLLSYPARKLAPLCCWLPGAWRGCLRAVREHRSEAILTSGPYHIVHVLGRELKRRFRLPWIADFRDPWIACNKLVQLDNSWRVRWETRQERAVMAEADVIVTNAPHARDALADAYPSARDRIIALTNGFDPEPFDGLAKPATADGGPLTILHPGQLYVGRDPRPFLDALRSLRAQRSAGARPIRAAFIGNLSADARGFDLDAEIRTRGLESAVTVGGQVPYAHSLVEMVRAEILLLLDTPGRRIGVPAKLYEYVGAGRPVLALGESDGDTAWVLRECGVSHRIAPPNDIEAIQRALSELVTEIEANPSLGQANPTRLRFTRENLTRQLADVLDHCMAASRAEANEPVAVSTR